MRQLRWVLVLAVSIWGAGCQPARSSPDLPAPSTQALTTEANPEPAAPPVVQPVEAEPTTEPVSPLADPAAGPNEVPTTQPAGPSTDQATDEPPTPATSEAANTEPPATTQTQPATTNAVESPKAALAGLMNATVRGDVEGVRTRLYVEGEETDRMAAAMIEVAEAAKKVRDASAEKFGWDNLKVLDIEIVPPLLLAGATETIEEDRATVQFPGQAAATTMRRVNGGWKLSLPDLVEVQKRTRNIDQVIAEARDPAHRLTALAERVSNGEFQSIEQVQQALAQSLFAAGETVKKE